MTAQFKDTQALVEACIADPELRSEFVNRVADKFQKHLQSYLEERELIAVDYCNAFTMKDADCCATHEFVDANEPMQEAVGTTVRSYAPGESDTSFTDLLDAELDIAEACSSIWGEAWGIAKSRGFSAFWAKKEAIADDDAFQSLAYVLLKRPDRSGGRYGPEDIRMANEHYPPFPAFITAGEEIDEAAELLVEVMDPIEAADLRDLAQNVARFFAGEDEAGLLTCLHRPFRNQPNMR